MWRAIGQPQAIAILDRGLKEGRVAHAYLFVGPPQVGKLMVALELAQALNCTGPEPPCGECQQCQRIASGVHADVQVVRGSWDGEAGGAPREIGIDQAKSLQHWANLRPFEGSYRVFIFDGAEAMSDEAANSLLKILEEPPPQVVVVLVAGDESRIIPTIRSRCQPIAFRRVPLSDVAQALADSLGTPQQEAESLARLSQGRLGWALAAARDPAALEERARMMQEIRELMNAGRSQRFAYASRLAARYQARDPIAQSTLAEWVIWWRDLTLMVAGCPQHLVSGDADSLRELADSYTLEELREFLRCLLDTSRRLEDNANPRLALEVLMLAMPHPRSGLSN